MNTESLQELMLAYVAGCADDAEKQRVEAWLGSGDITAHAAYAEALAVLHAVPLAIEFIPPPPDLRKRVLKRCGCGPSWSINWPLSGMTAIAACLALGLVFAVTRRDTEASSWQDIQRVMAAPDVTLAKMDVVPVSSGGTPKAAGAFGRVLYCPSTGQYEVHVFDLSPPPAGRVYELWLITPDKKPVAAGTFNVRDNGSGVITARLPAGASAVAAAITDEPPGGSSAPTGKMQLQGALAG